MNEKVGFFQSSPNHWSSVRLMSFMAFCAALVLIFVTAFSDGVSFGESFPMTLTLLAYSLGAKTFQQITDAMNKNNANKG